MSLVGNAIIEPYASDFAIIATPYVYDDIDHQERVFESGDPALEALYATTEEHGFVVLCTYSLGARNLYTRDGPVTTPEELKGLKIRVIGSDTCINMMNNMGGVGQGMPQGDVYSAIQTKVPSTVLRTTSSPTLTWFSTKLLLTTTTPATCCSPMSWSSPSRSSTR